MDVHAEHDPLAGQPFCDDCYDYDAHVIWQWWAPEPFFDKPEFREQMLKWLTKSLYDGIRKDSA